MHSPETAGTFRLQLLGSLHLQTEDGHIVRSVLAQPKRLALLVYLALARPSGFHRRDTLVALLWPELDAPHARNSLSQALSYLRRSLGEGVFEVRGTEEVGLASGRIRCDALELEAKLEAGEGEPATRLYQGELLPGFHLPDAPEFERWLENERARLRDRVAEAALRLSAAAEEEGDLPRGLAFAQRALAVSPLDEGALRIVLELLDATGDRAGAGAAYQAFAERLSLELDVEPAPETQALMESIRSRSAPISGGVRELAGDVVAPDPEACGAGEASPPRQAYRGGREAGWKWWVGSLGRRVDLAGIAVVFVFVILGSVWHSRSTANRGGAIRSVAVLPFVNLSADPENEYFSDGISEEILSALARVEGLRVPARTSAFRFKGAGVDVREAASQLKVEAIVEGSVRRVDGRVRISTRVVDARTGYQLWSGTYDRETRDIFAVQEEIARSVIEALSVRLRSGESERLARHSTEDAEAQMLYLKGRHLLLNRRSLESLESAASHFQQAVARDPNFAAAHAGLADVYTLTAVRGLGPQVPTLAKARAAIERALQLDSTSAEVHTSYAYVLESQHEWAAAEREFQRAIARQPRYVTARYWYSGLLTAMRRTEESIEQKRLALEVDPLSPALYSGTGKVFRLRGQRDSAIAYYQKALEISPHYKSALRGLARVHAEEGNFAVADSLLRAVSWEGDYRVSKAGIYVRMRRADEARQILKQAIASTGSAKSPVPGLIYELLGQRDSALAWLSDVEWGINWIIDIQSDPQWKPLRSDPRFGPILSSLNLHPPATDGQIEQPHGAGLR